MGEQKPEKVKKHICTGLLAHVDAGKTTLSEGMLYQSGCLRKLGRVDHQNAFLDTDALERERGITIFSKQAVLPLRETQITLLDTPGHVDFSTEMERTLQVLDYAVLVISGSDGVQSHTRTLWQLLSRYQIPTFVFVNKMDLAGTDRDALREELCRGLGEGCIDFGQPQESLWEAVALRGEQLLESYLEEGSLTDQQVALAVRERRVFPCFFGSALKLQGVDSLLEGLERFTLAPSWPTEFGARIFKIARDPQGNRLTYLKITGGSLRVKELLTNRGEEVPQSQIWEEKADQLRVYSGAKYQTVEEALPGRVCAVTGLSRSRPGEGLGWERSLYSYALEPVLTYQVLLPQGSDPYSALLKLRQLEEEEPQLHLLWREQLRQIHLQLMGEVQMEVLRRLSWERFGLKLEFDQGSILYKETISAPVEGVGHYEPLRHYAEVHLLLEPGEPGSGLHFDTRCSEDQLDRSWQRLILTHLEEKSHLGVLTGSPVTDLNITLVAGRAHEKHTEGGDFRQATYRAVRQGLMEAHSRGNTVLLEPWFRFRLELPQEYVGRGMSDLQRMSGRVLPPELEGETAVLTGEVPAAALGSYAVEVASYTGGRGKLSCTLQGYRPCHNQQEVVEALGYDWEKDLENTPDSVFCTHGAGHPVRWNQVREQMHLDSGLRMERPHPPQGEDCSAVRLPRAAQGKAPAYSGSLEEDRELQSIFERTYGPVRQRDFLFRTPARQEDLQAGRPLPSQDNGPEYLLVDGYNIIFAWEDLKAVAREDMDTARQLLIHLLCNYQGYKKCQVILVFDAYKVRGNLGQAVRQGNIYVVYTREAETADSYIEKVTYELGRRYRVKVATSDNAEQLIILGHGALRLSASAFREELEQANGEIASLLSANNSRQERSLALGRAMERAERRKDRGRLS